MQNYSAIEVFPLEVQRARELIERAWDLIPDSEGMLRCHELARIAQDVLSHSPKYSLRTVVMDGKYGTVEHSWLMFPWSQETHVLDVYCVGALPQVQLRTLAPPGSITHYNAGKPRTDIDTKQVERLSRFIQLRMEGKLPGPTPAEWTRALKSAADRALADVPKQRLMPDELQAARFRGQAEPPPGQRGELEILRCPDFIHYHPIESAYEADLAYETPIWIRGGKPGNPIGAICPDYTKRVEKPPRRIRLGNCPKCGYPGDRFFQEKCLECQAEHGSG